MNGHKTYSGLDRPTWQSPQVDRQGYQHKTRIDGPILPQQLLPQQSPSWLARIMGRV
jgi:hypothetical protein